MRTPPLGWLMLAQTLGAGSELAGQRLGRRCHHGSHVRMLLSASCYASVQAGVVLGIAQVVLPVSATGGQGPLTTWAQVVAHPGLLLNACNNAVYWLALLVLLREPLGPLLVVLGFLGGSFLVDPVSAAVGMPAGGVIPADAIVLGLAGAALCVVDVPADAIAAAWARRPRCCATQSRGRGRVAAEAPEDAPTPAPPQPTAGAPASALQRALLIASAFCVLALTTAIGIVFMTFYQSHAGLSAFGYTAVDSLLLPLTMVPLAALLDRSRALRALVGEPPWDSGSNGGGAGGGGSGGSDGVCSPGLGATLRRTWAELCASPCAVTTTTAGAAAPSTAAPGSDAASAARAAHAASVRSAASASPPLDAANGVAAHRAPESPAAQAQRQPSPPFERTGDAAESLPLVEASSSSSSSSSSSLGATPVARARAWPFGLTTLLPFHGAELLRTLLFFWLVTAFDVEATYLTLTLLRVALVWAASLAACTWLRAWVGISPAEAAATLHPASLCVRAGGSALLLAAVLRLKSWG